MAGSQGTFPLSKLSHFPFLKKERGLCTDPVPKIYVKLPFWVWQFPQMLGCRISKGLGSGSSPAYNTQSLKGQFVVTLREKQLMAVPVLGNKRGGRKGESSGISKHFSSPITSPGFYSTSPGIMLILQTRRWASTGRWSCLRPDSRGVRKPQTECMTPASKAHILSQSSQRRAGAQQVFAEMVTMPHCLSQGPGSQCSSGLVGVGR